MRVDQRWRLQRIADFVGLSRQRVYQITEVKMRGLPRPEDEPDQAEIARALRDACHDPDAWADRGLRRSWLGKRMTKASLGSMFPMRPGVRFQVILVYGLGLEDKAAQLAQIKEWQYGPDLLSYEKIAVRLSGQFVPIGTMAVWDGCKALGYKGRTKGAPGKPRAYGYDERRGAW